MKWKQAEAKWFLPKLIGQNRLYKELKVYSKNPAAFKKSDVCPLYDRLIETREYGIRLEHRDIGKDALLKK